ncbi:MAG: ankyrin repeat domain-containing protein [Sedimentitalea sp.]
MPTLPARPSLENLKKQAKSLLKSVKSSETDALALVGPYFGDPSDISLQQAQLVVARNYGFSSWTRLKNHVETGPADTPTTEQHANRFLDLVCLHYGPDNSRGSHNFEEAAALLKEHPDIAQHSLHTAAVTGALKTLRRMLAEDPGSVDQKGGPFQWSPLMYAAYARLPGVSSYPAGQALLDRGADPNAHYMWAGTYRFAVLTGIFGDGEGGKTRLPEHPEMVSFARAALDKGANPNDSQGGYNRCFNGDDTHLELMLEYGLKDSDASDWAQTDATQPPDGHRTMHFQLIIALRSGFADRARLLIEHGVDLNTSDANYYQTPPVSFTPYQVALLHGLPEIAALIKAKGGDSTPLTGHQQFRATCIAGDLATAKTLAPTHLGQEPEKEADLLANAASNGSLKAVETMIALGFDLSPPGRRTALHSAAWRGHLDIIDALLKAGADPKIRDPQHFSPPLVHALHAGNQPVIDVFMEAEMDIFMASAFGKTQQIDDRIAEDPSWINAPFARVRPRPEQDWPNDWAPPLWFAAMNGREDSARHLLNNGASADIADPSGRSMADYAEQGGHSEIAQLLKSAMR